MWQRPPHHAVKGTGARGLWRSFFPVAGQDGVELVAGADVELGEDLVQVVLDRARAHEEVGSDLRVGQAITGQPGDLDLPGGELGWHTGRAFTYSLAGREQLARGSFGEAVSSHGGEHLVRGAQLLAGIDPPVLPAQPLPVEEVGAGERHPDAGAGEAVDPLAVLALGGLALAEQRPRARLDPERPVAAAGAGTVRQPLEGADGVPGHPAAALRLDQLR